MSLTLQELRKRGPRVGTFVRKFYDKENFTFTDGSKQKITEVIFGSEKYNLKSIPAELLEAMSTRKVAASQVKIKVGNKTKALGTLAKTPEFGGQFDDGSSAEKKLDTTLYSELIATYCIAYRILKGKDLERDEFIDPKTGKLNEKTYNLLKKKIVQPASEALSKSDIRDNLAIYGMQSLGGSISKYNWLEQANVVAKTLLNNVKIPKSAVIYNDRFFAPGRKSFSNVKFNPYRVFSLSPTLANAVGPDKWNPADIWMVKDESKVKQHLDKEVTIDCLNNALQQLRADGKLVGISLKKIEGSPKMTLKNADDAKTRRDNEKAKFAKYDLTFDNGRRSDNHPMDVYLYYGEGNFDKFQARNFGGESKGDWKLELKGKSAAQGKIQGKVLRDLISNIVSGSVPKEADWNKCTGNEYDKEIFDLLKKYNAKGFNEETAMEFIADAKQAWKYSKLSGLRLLDWMSNHKKKDQIMKEIYLYASSQSDKSSVYWKLQ